MCDFVESRSCLHLENMSCFTSETLIRALVRVLVGPDSVLGTLGMRWKYMLDIHAGWGASPLHWHNKNTHSHFSIAN